MLEKLPDENTTFVIDCTNLLSESETISSLPEMSSYPSQGAITFGTPVVNSQALTLPDGSVVAVGKGIQVKIGGGTAQGPNSGRTYSVLAKFNTNQSNTMVAKAMLLILPIGP